MSKSINYVTAVGREVASARYRIYAPAETLGTQMRVAISNAPLGGFDIYFYQKHWSPSHLEQVRQLKAAGKRVIFDVTDNYFDAPEHGSLDILSFYAAMCREASKVTCPTASMAASIKKATGADAAVIADPALFPLKPASLITRKSPRLLWFGYSVGWPAVLKANEKSRGRLFSDYSWTVVSNMTPQRQEIGKGVFLPWAPGVVEEEIGKADIVILPVSHDMWAKTKSPNRVVESLMSGKFVVATQGVDSYEAFRDYIYMTTLSGIEKGITWAVNRSGEAAMRVRAGQEYVLQHHDLRTVSQKWKEAICG